MDRSLDTLVLIPTYNDIELLLDITNAVSSLPGNFVPLVVDDGSSNTVQKHDIANDALLVRLPTNFGLGTATHVAFDHARNYGYGFIARLDSDGQHPVEHLPELIKPLQDRSADMVVGKRINRDEGTGFRAWLAKSIRWYISTASKLVTAGETPQDMNSGFFAVTSDAAQKLNSLDLERYPEPQIFLSSDRLKIRIVEFDIIQNEREYGRSTISIFQALLLLYRFHMLMLELILTKSSVK
jgi:glycosyltransferase involved in cell wall biosynthesis